MARDDIAKALGVARSSVTGALQALKDKGLANYEIGISYTTYKKDYAKAREAYDAVVALLRTSGPGR